MSTRLIFVRHGFSRSNEAGLFTGQADVALTEMGKQQALCSAQYLKDTHIDKIYSSTLLRAYETAEPIAKMKNLCVTKLSGLCEINSGEWTEVSFEKIATKYPTEYNLWKNDMYYCNCPGGESVAEIFERVRKTVLDIAEQNDSKTVLIATHATPIRIICCLALGLEPQKLGSVAWSPNASINIIDYSDMKFTFVKKDIVEHLESCLTNLPSTI